MLVFLNGVWLALGAAWYGYTLWCLFRLGTKRSNHWFMTWPAQFSILACLSAYLLAIVDNGLGGVLAFSIMVFLPPIAVFLIFIPFVRQFVLPLFLFVFTPLAFWPATRRIAPSVAFIIALVTTPLTADLYWDRQMCASAAQLGLTEIQRPPFRYNLARLPNSSGRQPYAIANKGGEIWDWGYGVERFVRYGGDIPAWTDMSRFEPLTCKREGE